MLENDGVSYSTVRRGGKQYDQYQELTQGMFPNSVGERRNDDRSLALSDQTDFGSIPGLVNAFEFVRPCGRKQGPGGMGAIRPGQNPAVSTPNQNT